jgi:predicted dithiol-disulfide oxidoreductase (DUF899 family)
MPKRIASRDESPCGKATLNELFEGRSQLLVYHFMFAPSWEGDCAGCSEVADNFNGVIYHIQLRDASMVAVSRAPLSKLSAYAQPHSEFTYDFHVSYRDPERCIRQGRSRRLWPSHTDSIDA